MNCSAQALCFHEASESLLLRQSTPPGKLRCACLRFVIRAVSRLLPNELHSPASGAPRLQRGGPQGGLVGCGEDSRGPCGACIDTELHLWDKRLRNAAGRRGLMGSRLTAPDAHSFANRCLLSTTYGSALLWACPEGLRLPAAVVTASPTGRPTAAGVYTPWL